MVFVVVVCVCVCFFFFWLCHVACDFLVPQPGIEPTGLPGKSLCRDVYCSFLGEGKRAGDKEDMQ